VQKCNPQSWHTKLEDKSFLFFSILALFSATFTIIKNDIAFWYLTLASIQYPLASIYFVFYLKHVEDIINGKTKHSLWAMIKWRSQVKKV